ncbi:MAG: nucleotide exchange factor GrpE [Bacteroidales bacterium]|nr:nucleotide exchange factor GrpE [Bacteroidales bacterium]HNW74569.1 nucleotide exchange factor GrpE [Bacteroidales bacterium]HPS50120.1 nucleotide exchange factor GrpE [Bacteroidales bacterium]
MIKKKNKEEKELKKETDPMQDEIREDPETDRKNEASEKIDPETMVENPEEKIAELNDKYLRLYSEFDNYRKRTLKEKAELSKFASADVITSLLPVLDDFERAIKAFTATSDNGTALKEGVVLIFNKFLSVLNQQGLEQMKTQGESFDTDFHEAVTNVPAANPDQKGKVVDEILKGYLLNGRVIRFAKVVVGS